MSNNGNITEKFDLKSSTELVNGTFREKQVVYVDSHIKSILETEDFSEFSNYIRGGVVSYFKAFLNRLFSKIWMHYADYETNPEFFFKPMLPKMIREITVIKQDLIQRKVVTDLMTDEVLENALSNFFEEYEKRAEFQKVTEGYLLIRKEFENIIDLTNSFYSCGADMVKCSEELFSLYLLYKEAIFKGMGFDVKLEYFSVDNFDLIYRDERLADAQARKEYETIAMNAALKAAMPGFDGDINVFARIVESL